MRAECASSREKGEGKRDKERVQDEREHYCHSRRMTRKKRQPIVPSLAPRYGLDLAVFTDAVSIATNSDASLMSGCARGASDGALAAMRRSQKRTSRASFSAMHCFDVKSAFV
jgi:hypothetical protein